MFSMLWSDLAMYIKLISFTASINVKPVEKLYQHVIFNIITYIELNITVTINFTKELLPFSVFCVFTLLLCAYSVTPLCMYMHNFVIMESLYSSYMYIMYTFYGIDDGLSTVTVLGVIFALILFFSFCVLY